MNKIGIYSGTFDPIHDGHLKFAKKALKECNIDKIYFLVEPIPRRKVDVASIQDRIHMVELATDNAKSLEVLHVEQDQFSVADTLPDLLSRFVDNELNFLLGDDLLESLMTWPNASDLLRKAHLIVGQRRSGERSIRSKIEDIENMFDQKIAYDIVQVNSKTSSGEVKSHLRSGKKPNLPVPVYDHIKEKNLYQKQITSDQ